MSKETRLMIILLNPLDGVMYGLQKGKGADYETVQAQPGKGKDLSFEFTIQLKQAKGPGISLGGPFVQGPVGNRFVYLTIVSYAGQSGFLCNGRLKVPLSEADFQDSFSDDGTYSWSCTVPGQTEDGKPVFATVKPFGGWSIRKLSD
jgi:hypothetical protein